jgi:hypothetical protein
MPVAIDKELSADPSTLVVKPHGTRLSLSVNVFGGPLSATITYKLPANRPVHFASATCTEPAARVVIDASSKTLTIEKFPLPSDRDVVVHVEFTLDKPPATSMKTFDVDATVRASDNSTADTSCDISF